MLKGDDESEKRQERAENKECVARAREGHWRLEVDTAGAGFLVK